MKAGVLRGIGRRKGARKHIKLRYLQAQIDSTLSASLFPSSSISYAEVNPGGLNERFR